MFFLFHAKSIENKTRILTNKSLCEALLVSNFTKFCSFLWINRILWTKGKLTDRLNNFSRKHFYTDISYELKTLRELGVKLMNKKMMSERIVGKNKLGLSCANFSAA